MHAVQCGVSLITPFAFPVARGFQPEHCPVCFAAVSVAAFLGVQPPHPNFTGAGEATKTFLAGAADEFSRPAGVCSSFVAAPWRPVKIRAPRAGVAGFAGSGVVTVAVPRIQDAATAGLLIPAGLDFQCHVICRLQCCLQSGRCNGDHSEGSLQAKVL